MDWVEGVEYEEQVGGMESVAEVVGILILEIT